jgi:CBS domain containing-hemolysin-like protein
MSRLERLPGEGDTVEEEDYRFIVLDLEGRRAGQVQIERVDAEGTPATDV